jgi:RNA polymerase primary sigma factor
LRAGTEDNVLLRKNIKESRDGGCGYGSSSMTCPQAKDCGNTSSLNTYLREIRDDPLLSAAEERALAEAIAQGDGDARTRMIQANLRLVVKIAREYVGRGLVLDDLIGEGNLGLIRATEEYDPGFGTRFSTYASYWIKQAIRHALINTTATIRLPAHMVGLLTKWRRAERALTREFGYPPTFDQVAVSLGLTDSQKALVEKARRARQLRFESSGDDGGTWSPDDSMAERDAPEATLEADDERKNLLKRMEQLDARERAILALRFGLEGELPLTLKEVGRRLGVTREWVRKIEIRAVRKLDDTMDAPEPVPVTKVARPSTRSREHSRNRLAVTCSA